MSWSEHLELTVSKMKLLFYEASFYASSLAFWDPAFILIPNTWQLLCKYDLKGWMNSSSYPSWNSETCLGLYLPCGWPHPVWLPSHVSSMSGVSLVFLHSHCHYLDIAVDFLLVFIFPYLSLANLFYVLLLEQSWLKGLMMMMMIMMMVIGIYWTLTVASLFLCAYVHYLIKSM